MPRVEFVWPVLDRVWILRDHIPGGAARLRPGTAGPPMTGAPGVRFFVSYRADRMDGQALLVSGGRCLARGHLGMQETHRAFQIAEVPRPAPAMFAESEAAVRGYLRWSSVELPEEEVRRLAPGGVIEAPGRADAPLELVCGGEIVAQGETVDGGEFILFQITAVVLPHSIAERVTDAPL